MTTREYRSATKGKSWKFRLMNTIDQCMRYARSKEEFRSLMESEGYQLRWTDTRKSITYTTPDGKRCRDDRLHDEKYRKEKMEDEFRIRQEIFAGEAKGVKPNERFPGDESTGRNQGQYRTIRQERMARKFGSAKRHFFAGILGVFQEKATHLRAKFSASRRRRHCAVLPKVECTISPELAEELVGLMELTIRELREIKARLGRLSTEEERKQGRRLLERISTAIEQAGKKKERRFSLPRFQIPEFNLTWLLAIPVAAGLLVGCYALRHSWDVLWNFFRPLFQ